MQLRVHVSIVVINIDSPELYIDRMYRVLGCELITSELEGDKGTFVFLVEGDFQTGLNDVLQNIGMANHHLAHQIEYWGNVGYKVLSVRIEDITRPDPKPGKHAKP